jgi:hypothetical protein
MKWLFLIDRLKNSNSKQRVKIWRMTKKIGAVLYRNSVYVLPFSKERLEDFQWLAQQIKDAGAEASVFISESISEKESNLIKNLINNEREKDYTHILENGEKLLLRLQRIGKDKLISDRSFSKFEKELTKLVMLFKNIQKNDFFNIPGGKKTESLLKKVKIELYSMLDNKIYEAPLKRYSIQNYRNKKWVTRKNIHIDRLCSAWLIKKFIDPEAKFIFEEETNFPKDAIPFDSFGVEFSHRGEDCTFETLIKTFRIDDKILKGLSEIVHDIDLKDNKFSRKESDGLDLIVKSLSSTLKDDYQVLKEGCKILDAIYEYLRTMKRKR